MRRLAAILLPFLALFSLVASATLRPSFPLEWSSTDFSSFQSQTASEQFSATTPTNSPASESELEEDSEDMDLKKGESLPIAPNSCAIKGAVERVPDPRTVDRDPRPPRLS